MKNKILFAAACLLSLFLYNSCSKEVISRNDEFPSLDPAMADTNAHSWLPVLLTSPGEFACDSPGAVTSPAYVADLNEIKGLQANITDAQRALITYWSAGGVLRWNEILRELVAKYNIPTYQNPDGSYPIPSAANPFAYPQFPFSNPPYAARAYAYVSAAQYDALVAASYYQNRYKRSSPNKVNSGVQLLVPASQVSGYAYPSEASTIDGATVEMLKLLFPTEIAYIEQKAYEHQLARMLVGASTRNDLDAGDKLGRLVASKFVARARTDNASKAVGDAAYWAQLEQQTIASGEIPWISQENPKRPPMLPKFGFVKGFLVDSMTVVAMRPAAPPSTSSQKFQDELNEVLWYSDHVSLERTHIVHFWADGVGTYTPPGHWNAIACEIFVGERYSEYRYARNLALLNMAMMDAAICCWDAKYAYFNPRPSQINPNIKTVTGLPNFPSYVSGHSTFSYAAATFLSHILPSQASTFQDYANEATLSRLYGCIHYRSDCEVGKALGKGVGDHAVLRAEIDGAE